MCILLQVFFFNYVFKNLQTSQTTQISFNGWMDKPTVLHPYSRILLCVKTEGTIDTCNAWDDSQSPYAEWKKSVSENYIPYDSTYMTFLKSQNYGEQGLGMERVWLQRGNTREFFGLMELFSILIVVVVYLYMCFKFMELYTHQKKSTLLCNNLGNKSFKLKKS